MSTRGGNKLSLHLAGSPAAAPGRRLCHQWEEEEQLCPPTMPTPPTESTRLAGSSQPPGTPAPCLPPSHPRQDDAQAPGWLPAWHAALPQVGVSKQLLSPAHLQCPDLGRPLQSTVDQGRTERPQHPNTHVPVYQPKASFFHTQPHPGRRPAQSLFVYLLPFSEQTVLRGTC